MKISFRKEKNLVESLKNSGGNCSTCKYAIKLTISEDFLCSRCGIVDESYSCNRYKVNHLMKRPPRKRNNKSFESRFKKEDFSIV